MQSTRPSAARPADTTTQKSAPQRRAPRATGCALQGGSSVLTRTAPPPRSAPYLATEGATVKQNARLGGRLSAQMRWHGLSYSGIERSAARLQMPHAGAPVSLVRRETPLALDYAWRRCACCRSPAQSTNRFRCDRYFHRRWRNFPASSSAASFPRKVSNLQRR